MAHFSGYCPYTNIFEYLNVKLNEYTIFEYFKTLHCLVGRSTRNKTQSLSREGIGMGESRGLILSCNYRGGAACGFPRY